ncbi:MAG: Hint domain-containing protein, partial [Rhodobacteraceae bacterium]|nr:Hint domain-containing protein [Paracoccaceae bacterium]
MTWIAIRDRDDAIFAPSGVANRRDDGATATEDFDRPMPRGSVLLETRLSPYEGPQLLLGLKRGFDAAMSLMLRAVPGGGISLVHTRGGEMCHAALTHDAEARRTDVLRITYSWDMAHGWARLAVERPDVTHCFQAVVRTPVPLTLADVRDMICDPVATVVDDDVLFLAVSDRIEPIGPMPGLMASLPVETAQGTRALGDLRRGDLVETLDGRLVPVLDVLRRTVPARGLFEPVRLRHPYFGLARDIVVTPGQCMLVGGSRVEYLFGREHVLVPAGHLAGGAAGLRERGHELVTYTQLLLPEADAICAAGA